MAEAQTSTETEIKIAVLTSHPDTIDASPLQAMRIAADDLNAEYSAINTKVTLKEVDVSDFVNLQRSLIPKIVAAHNEGFTHFIGPSHDVAFGAVAIAMNGIISNGALPALENSIMISPGSSSVSFGLDADDNFFRLAPNANTAGLHVVSLFDKYGLDKVVPVSSIQGIQPVDDVHDHFEDTFVPIPAYDSSTPNSYSKNVESAKALNDRLGSLIQQYGDGSVGVLFLDGMSFYSDFVKAAMDNPELDNIGNVMWISYPVVVDSVQTDLGPFSLARPLNTVLASSGQISSDPALAEFSARVQLTALPFEVERNEINAVLDVVPSHPAFSRNYIYAAYDAVHLLADSIAVSGADNPNLKRTIYEVSNGEHAVEHERLILGEGALGDYVLDPQTGDLIEGGSFVEYRFVESGSGYIWEKIVERTCR